MIPPNADPPTRFTTRTAAIGAHGSAETPSASGAGAATDAECGIRRAAAERVVVIAGSSFVRWSAGSSCFGCPVVRPIPGRGFRANENGRRVRPPRFRGNPVSQTSPWGSGAALTAWDATPVSCAEHNRAPHPPSRGFDDGAGSRPKPAPHLGLQRCLTPTDVILRPGLIVPSVHAGLRRAEDLAEDARGPPRKPHISRGNVVRRPMRGWHSRRCRAQVPRRPRLDPSALRRSVRRRVRRGRASG